MYYYEVAKNEESYREYWIDAFDDYPGCHLIQCGYSQDDW